MCQKKKELLERKIGGQTSKIGAALNNRHHEASVYLSCYTYIHDMSTVIQYTLRKVEGLEQYSIQRMLAKTLKIVDHP